MKKPWWKDSTFWIVWVAQAIFGYIGLWLIMGPIFEKTMLNAGQAVETWQLAIMVLGMLFSFLLFQIIALGFYPKASWKIKGLIIAGTYIVLIGPILAIGIWLADAFKTLKKVPRLIRIVIFVILTYLVVVELNTVFSIAYNHLIIIPTLTL